MRKVLILGGAGFVGRHLALALLDQGAHVTIIDDLSSGIHPAKWTHDAWLLNSFLNMDARTFFRHSALCDFDTVFHCAAVVGGRALIEGDPLKVATDLSIDAEFFNWLSRVPRKPQRAVYFSSSAAYPVELQTRENHCRLCEEYLNFNGTKIPMPDQTYGWSKLSGEYLAQYAVKTYGVPVVVYRPFGGYGGDQSLDYPFPSIIKRAVERELPKSVWGSGEQQRDFIHIDDVVEAVFATMFSLRPGEVLNLGTGIATSFLALAERACQLAGHEIPGILCDDAKPEGVFYRVADTTRLFQLYRPKITLETGISRAIEKLDKK